MAKRDGNGVLVTDRGYVVGIGCSLNHSGNDGFVECTRGYYQCQGCGTSRSADDILRSQRDASVV
jgi:hypothetical protein